MLDNNIPPLNRTPQIGMLFSLIFFEGYVSNPCKIKEEETTKQATANRKFLSYEMQSSQHALVAASSQESDDEGPIACRTRSRKPNPPEMAGDTEDGKEKVEKSNGRVTI